LGAAAQYQVTRPEPLPFFERGEDRLSNRGFGTLTRTDPVFQGCSGPASRPAAVLLARMIKPAIIDLPAAQLAM